MERNYSILLNSIIQSGEKLCKAKEKIFGATAPGAKGTSLDRFFIVNCIILKVSCPLNLTVMCVICAIRAAEGLFSTVYKQPTFFACLFLPGNHISSLCRWEMIYYSSVVNIWLTHSLMSYLQLPCLEDLHFFLLMFNFTAACLYFSCPQAEVDFF